MGRSLVATYSIVACDLDAGQWGVAVQSKFLAVGSVVPWAEPHVGAIATQSYANPRYGPDGLALLREGRSAEEVVSTLTAADEGRAQRQVGVVDGSRSTRISSASLLAKTGSAWTRHLRASWATGWRSSATTERSTRHSSTGPERRISRSASTASGKSTRSCSKHYANSRHEDDPNQRHRSDSHREGRAPVATGPAHARNRGLRH